jgi:integrase
MPSGSLATAPWRPSEGQQNRGFREGGIAGVENAKPSHRTRSLRIAVSTISRPASTRLRNSAKKENTPCVRQTRLSGVGWHTFRHTVGTLLAEMGGHQLTIRGYLHHSNLSVTNKYLQAGSATRRKAQEKLVAAILPSQLRVAITAEAAAP